MSSTAVFTRTSFYTVNGKIRSAAVSTKSRVDFLKDAQGNVVATTNYGTSQGIRQRFTPYGKVLGGTPVFYTDLRMGYGGAWGYRRTAMQHAEKYIRARTMAEKEARWTTRDRHWPIESAYGYLAGRALKDIDASGNGPGNMLAACIETWTRLGYSKRSACLRCKDAQGYVGVYHCENLPDNGAPVPKWEVPLDIIAGVCIIPHAGEGLVSDFDQKGCENTCRLSNFIAKSELNSKVLNKACLAGCLALAQKGCDGLFARCTAMGDTTQGDDCMVFYNFVCSGF